MAWLDGHPVFASAGSDPEGRVLYVAAGGTVTVIDYIRVMPAS